MRKAVQTHLYIHVPFCNGKCAYCGFYSVRYTPAYARQWLAALDAELKVQARAFTLALETIYIGGGTPTILNKELLAGLLSIIRRHADTSGIKEWTVEANPGTIDDHVAELLASNGVNRVSLGVQSFRNSVLRSIERRHKAEAVPRTMKILRAAGITNIGLDLIATLPGVSLTTWCSDIETATALRPGHISIYALSLENQSKLGRAAEAGMFHPPSDVLQIEFLQIAEKYLNIAGFRRYEISNYARPGYECLHNLSCWRGEDYIGFGPAAASRAGLCRWMNLPSLQDYCIALSKGKLPPREKEKLSLITDIAERWIFQLRTQEGISLTSLHSAASRAPGLIASLRREIIALQKLGLLIRSGNRWRATPRGWEVADSIAERLFCCFPE